MAWCLARIGRQPGDSALIPGLLESATRLIIAGGSQAETAQQPDDHQSASATLEAFSLSSLARSAARVRCEPGRKAGVEMFITCGCVWTHKALSVNTSILSFHRYLDRAFLDAMLRRLTSPGGALHRVAAADLLADPGQIQMDLEEDPGGGMSPVAAKNILWALATLNYRADPSVSDGSASTGSSAYSAASSQTGAAATNSAISLLVEEATLKLPSFRPHELANVMWALAVLQQQGTHVHSFVEAASTQLLHLTPKCKRQVFMFMLAAEEADAVGAELRDDVSLYRELRKACLEAWRTRRTGLRQPSSSSRVQREVLRELRRLPLPGCRYAKLHHLTADGLFHIDIALPSVVSRGGNLGGIGDSSSPAAEPVPAAIDGGRTFITRMDNGGIAIEVDGPSRFLAASSTASWSGGKTLGGSTALRNRLLSARGWRVVNVPVEEWGRLPQGGGGNAAAAGGRGPPAGELLSAQQRYLMEKLKSVL